MIAQLSRMLASTFVFGFVLFGNSCTGRPVAEPMHDAGRDLYRGVNFDGPPAPRPTSDLSPPAMPKDAALPSVGCQAHLEGGDTSCKSEEGWTGYATASCQQKGLPVIVDIEFLEPCGGGYFRYVRATCCSAADGW